MDFTIWRVKKKRKHMDFINTLDELDGYIQIGDSPDFVWLESDDDKVRISIEDYEELKSRDNS